MSERPSSERAESAVIHVIDDDEAVRDSLAFLLASAGHTVLTHSSAQAFVEAGLPGADPDAACIITDVRMPDMTGIDLLRYLKERGSVVPVVVVTGHGDVPLAVQAMEKGAVTFLEKPFQDSALESALARAFELGAPARPATTLPEAPAGQAALCAEYQRRRASLSPRELQVMQGVVEGKISKLIARELDISTKTVELHRSRVMAKMQADSVVHLTRMALGQRVS